MTAQERQRGSEAERRVSERPRRESRHGAREAAVQMLYQWEVGKLSMLEVTSTYWALHDPPSAVGDPQSASDSETDTAESGPRTADREFAMALTTGVAATLDRIDPLIAEAAEHWRLERMAVMDRIILRLAVYELLEQPETPARVVINEALELARTFSTDDAVRFINGILDAVRRRLGRE